MMNIVERCRYMAQVAKRDDMRITLTCAANEIERQLMLHAEIIKLSDGWDDSGSTGPRVPLSWESVGRIAMDISHTAMTPNVEVSG